MTGFLGQFPERIEQALAAFSANLKLVDQALSGMQGSYVELLTVLALGLLGVLPVLVPERRRQFWRHLLQAFGVIIFIFIVYTCLGVFGLVRNFYRGLQEIGRENIIALYFVSVPLTVLVTSMLFGPAFCGWICPTGALQELASLPFRKWHQRRKRAGWPFSPALLLLALGVAGVFAAWMVRLSLTRVFFVEDASLYWSEILVLILFLLVWRMGEWDRRLRRLRVLSFWIVFAAAVIGWRITSPVHFGFNKVYDPASLLSTVMVVLAALAVPHVWCRYLCPWREAIGWAGKHSARRLVTDPGKCTGCGVCDRACNVDAVEKGVIDRRECHFCLRCVDACPQKAIRLEETWTRGDIAEADTTARPECSCRENPDGCGRRNTP